MRNIYLIGMMGSGKSVTGKKLAALLGYEFLDLDDRIQEQSRRTIPDIFEKEGEDYFRDQEAAVLRTACELPRHVIATGGGSILRPENVQRMHKTGKIVYLETSPEVLWERVRGRKDRPLIQGENPQENLVAILSKRKAIYEKVCDLRVGTDGQSPEAVAKKIMDALAKAL